MIRRVTATRYVVPLREGGSLPAIVEADDGQTYVVKFRGAGQGVRTLIAEVVAGELGRALGLRIPELVIVELDPLIGRNEGDPEIQELLLASVGDNAGLAFLAGALGFDPAVHPTIDAVEAAQVITFDAFIQNMDRTVKNTNLLWSSGLLWLIDHGAALYWQHDWDGGLAGYDAEFPLISRHVLLPWASRVPEQMAWLREQLTDHVIAEAIAGVPESWWIAPPELSAAEFRVAFAARLQARRDVSTYLEEAERARTRTV